MEGNVGGGSQVLGEGTRQVDAVRGVLLEVQDKVGRQEVPERFQDCGGFLVYLLDGSLDLVAVGVRGGTRDMRAEETQGSGEGSADSVGVRAEGCDLVTSELWVAMSCSMGIMTS